MKNGTDLNQFLKQFDLGLHCLFRPVYKNVWNRYGIHATRWRLALAAIRFDC